MYITISPSGNTTSNSATYRVGVDPEQIKSYHQSLSLRNGIVETTVSWSPFNSPDLIKLQYTVLAHRSRPNLGLVRLDVSGLKKGQQVVITDALDGAGAQRVEGERAGKLDEKDLAHAIYSSVRPLGIKNVTAWEISVLNIIGVRGRYTAIDVPKNVGLGNDKSTVAQSYSMMAPSDGKLTAIKTVGIASSDAFEGYEKETALATATRARSDEWDKLVDEHDKAWKDLWADGGEIVIHGARKPNKRVKTMLDELQLTTHSSLFHLLANVRNGHEGKGLGDNSIAPAGLTSDSYAGGIFWDADTWMYPSLLSLFPDYAMSINNYRSKNMGSAIENAKQYNRAGLLYPWVGFRFGNCTGE